MAHKKGMNENHSYSGGASSRRTVDPVRGGMLGEQDMPAHHFAQSVHPNNAATSAELSGYHSSPENLISLHEKTKRGINERRGTPGTWENFN